MKKLEDLREYLLTNVPALGRDPDRLLTFIENGQILFYPGDNYSHRYLMPITIIVTDWAGSADEIVIPVLEWLAVREPGFDPQTAIRFDAEIIDKEKTDIQIQLQVTERVVVTFDGATRTITHVLPPVPLQMNPDAEWMITATGPGDE
jgi:hypothetical protein